jgi:alkane 1-monooxygenase
VTLKAAGAMQQTHNPTARADNPKGQPTYRDPKRWVWILSLLVPMTVGIGPALMLATGSEWALWLPVVLFYLVFPAIDWFLGTDTTNPPEWAVPGLQADRYYRHVTYALVPLLWAAFIGSAWFVAHHALSWPGQIAMVMIAGSVGGFCINLAHELGHKSPHLERWLAKLALAPSWYGHFTVEHNRGHHQEVATPHDSASSRMGETIYTFVWREMPGGLRRAWALEARRLRGLGLPAWHWRNDILQAALISACLWAGILAAFGWTLLPYLLAAAFWSNFQLTSANYIEHYGLLRQKLPDGRFEPCSPRHSWNSNHSFSNWVLFHLQRHSDHHAHPARRYQALRHFDDSPQLPSGYFGMFVLAYIPPLWFAVMNPRLVKWAKSEARHIHFLPGKQAALTARWGLKATA